MTDEDWAKLIAWLKQKGLVLVVPKKGPPEFYRKRGAPWTSQDG